MRRIGTGAPLLALGLAAISAGCGGQDGIVGIGVGVDIDRQTITGFASPATSCDLAGGVIAIDAVAPFSVRLREEEELQGRDLLELTNVELQRVTLRIVDVPAGDSDSWDFLDSIRLFADDPNDARPPVLVGVLDPVPNGVDRIVIPGTGADISDIASQDSFTISAEVTGRPPCDDVNFAGQADFRIEL